MPLFTNQTKKKFAFKVLIKFHELELVPFTCIIFAKVKIKNSYNSFTHTTSKHQVKNHTVKWNQNLTLLCNFIADTNGYLFPCICKISIRKELKGGKAHEKLGFVNVNLSQFAGSGSTLQHFLLQSSAKRSVNSILKLTIDMVQRSGDSCYKVSHPIPQTLSKLLEDECYNISNNEINCFCAPFIQENFQHKNCISSVPLVNSDKFYVDPQDNDDDKMQNDIESYPTSESIDCTLGDIKDDHSQHFDKLNIKSASLPRSLSLASDGVFNLYTKRLSTIDCVSYRICSSRVDAQNAVDELLHMKMLHSTSNFGTKSVLTLNSKGSLEVEVVEETCTKTKF